MLRIDSIIIITRGLRSLHFTKKSGGKKRRKKNKEAGEMNVAKQSQSCNCSFERERERERERETVMRQIDHSIAINCSFDTSYSLCPNLSD